MLFAIGDDNFTAAFAAVGAEMVICGSEAELKKSLQRIRTAKSRGIIFIEEKLAATAAETVEEFKTDFPGFIVLTLPSTLAESHFALDEIRRIIEKSTGANLLGEY